MLFNLSRCLCAENFCNLHAIIATLLIFLQKYLVFVLSPSSFFILLFEKLAGATFPDPKEAGIEIKLQ
jgi:hypothetical protein